MILVFYSSMNLIENHKKFILWYQRKLNLSDYGLLWLVFFKGIFTTIFLQYLLSRMGITGF